MKLKNIILPLSFLSLTPTAKAQQTQPAENDSVANKKFEIIATPNTATPDTTNAFNVAEAIKNDTILNKIIERLQTPKLTPPDTTTKATPIDTTTQIIPLEVEEEEPEEDVITPLVESYNKNPYTHNFDKMLQLFNLMTDPFELYDRLEIPIRHAIILTDVISPELQEKLHIKDKNDILTTSLEKKPEVLTDEEAFNFIADGHILNIMKKPERVIEKSLNIALQNLDSIFTNPRKMECLTNTMEYTLKHQDNSMMADLYMKIFIATTNIIRQFDADKDKENIHLESINQMSLAIEKFNREIIPNSVLDQEIKIKSPRDFVLNEYQDITHRINMTKIYNEAYYAFLTNKYKANRQKFNHPAIQQLYSDYIEAIELLTRARNKKITDAQRDRLSQLTQKYPEISLLDPYFSNIYVNTDNYDKFLNFITSIHATQSDKKQKIPPEIQMILSDCQKQVNTYRAMLGQYSINLPDIQIMASDKISYPDVANGPLNPYETFKKIDSTLYQQARALTFQQRALRRLAKTGPQTQDAQYLAMTKSR